MATYLITNKQTEQLDVTVFSSDGGEAVAVFTDLKIAQQYLDDADWNSEFTVATLEPIDFLEWLIQCHRNGVKFLVTNPIRADHESGLKLDTLDIEAHLNHAGQHISLVADPEF